MTDADDHCHDSRYLAGHNQLRSLGSLMRAYISASGILYDTEGTCASPIGSATRGKTFGFAKEGARHGRESRARMCGRYGSSDHR